MPTLAEIALDRLRHCLTEQEKRTETGLFLNAAENKARQMMDRGGAARRRGQDLLAQIEAARRRLVE